MARFSNFHLWVCTHEPLTKTKQSTEGSIKKTRWSYLSLYQPVIRIGFLSPDTKKSITAYDYGQNFKTSNELAYQENRILGGKLGEVASGAFRRQQQHSAGANACQVREIGLRGDIAPIYTTLNYSECRWRLQLLQDRGHFFQVRRVTKTNSMNSKNYRAKLLPPLTFSLFFSLTHTLAHII